MTFSTVPVTPASVTVLRARPEALVDAARVLANETGDAAFTVAQVTARAGCSLKTFYRCFRGKDDLLLALLATESRTGADLLAERLGDRTGPGALGAFTAELFAMLRLPGAAGYAGVLAREHLRLGEHHDTELRAALAPLLELLAARLGTETAARDAEIVFGVLLGGIRDVVFGRVGDLDAHAAALARFCCGGVWGAWR
ncbi:MAG: TetR/AcrR family transcriptional regulator [Actinomycetota bacterium]